MSTSIDSSPAGSTRRKSFLRDIFRSRKVSVRSARSKLSTDHEARSVAESHHSGTRTTHSTLYRSQTSATSLSAPVDLKTEHELGPEPLLSSTVEEADAPGSNVPQREQSLQESAEVQTHPILQENRILELEAKLSSLVAQSKILEESNERMAQQMDQLESFLQSKSTLEIESVTTPQTEGLFDAGEMQALRLGLAEAREQWEESREMLEEEQAKLLERVEQIERKREMQMREWEAKFEKLRTRDIRPLWNLVSLIIVFLFLYTTGAFKWFGADQGLTEDRSRWIVFESYPSCRTKFKL